MLIIESPKDAVKLRANPLGIYVNAINCSKELADGKTTASARPVKTCFRYKKSSRQQNTN